MAVHTIIPVLSVCFREFNYTPARIRQENMICR